MIELIQAVSLRQVENICYDIFPDYRFQYQKNKKQEAFRLMNELMERLPDISFAFNSRTVSLVLT